MQETRMIDRQDCRRLFSTATAYLTGHVPVSLNPVTDGEVTRVRALAAAIARLCRALNTRTVPQIADLRRVARAEAILTADSPQAHGLTDHEVNWYVVVCLKEACVDEAFAEALARLPKADRRDMARSWAYYAAALVLSDRLVDHSETDLVLDDLSGGDRLLRDALRRRLTKVVRAPSLIGRFAAFLSAGRRGPAPAPKEESDARDAEAEPAPAPAPDPIEALRRRLMASIAARNMRQEDDVDIGRAVAAVADAATRIARWVNAGRVPDFDALAMSLISSPDDDPELSRQFVMQAYVECMRDSWFLGRLYRLGPAGCDQTVENWSALAGRWASSTGVPHPGMPPVNDLWIASALAEGHMPLHPPAPAPEGPSRPPASGGAAAGARVTDDADPFAENIAVFRPRSTEGSEDPPGAGRAHRSAGTQ